MVFLSVSSICFSPSRHGGSNTEYDINSISTRIDLGIKALDVFWESRNRFKNDPCYNSKTQADIIEYTPSQQLDDRSIAYLAHNPHQLIRCEPSVRDLTLRGVHYRVNQIQIIKNIKNTDVLENQVILYFLYEFLTFLHDITENTTKKSKTNDAFIEVNGEQFISIDRILSESGLLLNMQKSKALNYIEKIKEAINFINNNIPCSRSLHTPSLPEISHRVLIKQHYFNLFKHIKNYYSAGEPDLSGKDMVYGIRNVSKLYELVCLTQLIQEINELGFTCTKFDYRPAYSSKNQMKPINEPNNFYRFQKEKETIDLWYEPEAMTLGQESANSDISYSIIDIKETRRINYQPDFILVHSSKGKKKAHILDAKYSSSKIVKNTHLPDVANKYLQFIKLKTNNYDPVSSITVLFSDDYSGYISNHHNKARIIDTQGKINNDFLSPSIGAVSLNPKNNSIASLLIKKLITNNT